MKEPSAPDVTDSVNPSAVAVTATAATGLPSGVTMVPTMATSEAARAAGAISSPRAATRPAINVTNAERRSMSTPSPSVCRPFSLMTRCRGA